MGYLQPTEYVAYGLSAETSDDWITTASALMEGYCHRPTLLAAQYVERLRVTQGSQTVRLSYLPLAPTTVGSSPILSVRARLIRGRRGEMHDRFFDDVVAAFSAPGSWTSLDPSTLDVANQTGEVTLASNLLGLTYGEIEITYLAGVSEIPDALKVACAQIVRNAQATPGLNVKSSKIDTLQLQYFSGSLLDDQVRSLLRPYVGQRLG